MPPTLTNRIVTLLIFTFLSVSHADEKWFCQTGKIKTTTFGKAVIINSDYCYNSNKTALMSKTCQKNACLATQTHKKFSAHELLSTSGKPGFKLCRELGGDPEIITFTANDGEFKLDRCIFKDNSFIDTDTLLSKSL